MKEIAGRIRRFCVLMSAAWGLVAIQLYALGAFDTLGAVLFTIGGYAMWLLFALFAPWVLD